MLLGTITVSETVHENMSSPKDIKAATGARNPCCHSKRSAETTRAGEGAMAGDRWVWGEGERCEGSRMFKDSASFGLG